MNGSGTDSGEINFTANQELELDAPLINITGPTTGTCANALGLNTAGDLVLGGCYPATGAVLLQPPSATPQKILIGSDTPNTLQLQNSYGQAPSGGGDLLELMNPTTQFWISLGETDGTVNSAGELRMVHSGTGYSPIDFQADGGFNFSVNGSTNALSINYQGNATFLNPVDAPILNAGTGFQLAGAAPSGHCLVGNGTDYVDSSSCGAVESVSNSDGSVTISPTTGAVVASLNTANGNTWSASQTFNDSLNVTGGSFGVAAVGAYFSGSTDVALSGGTIFEMAPTNTAISGTNYSSVIGHWQASYWNGTTASRAGFLTQAICATGNNPLCTLTHTFTPNDHSTTGGSATAAESFAYPISVAVSGGVGGTFSANEGTAPSAAAGQDILYADSASHCMMYSANGSSFSCLGSGGSSGFPITLGSTSIAATSTTTSVAGLTIDGVTPATMAFLDATSSIQTQLNGKWGTSYGVTLPSAGPALNNSKLSCSNATPSVCTWDTGSTETICSGTISIPATAIASGAKSEFTGTCTGGATTDNVLVDFAGGTDPTTLTGFAPGTGGILTVLKWVTANTVNVALENNTAASITPTAFTLNYRVTR